MLYIILYHRDVQGKLSKRILASDSITTFEFDTVSAHNLFGMSVIILLSHVSMWCTHRPRLEIMCCLVSSLWNNISIVIGFCVAETQNMTIFKNLFIQVYSPYSLKRREQAEIRASIFNYGDKTEKVCDIHVMGNL